MCLHLCDLNRICFFFAHVIHVLRRWKYVFFLYLQKKKKLIFVWVWAIFSIHTNNSTLHINLSWLYTILLLDLYTAVYFARMTNCWDFAHISNNPIGLPVLLGLELDGVDKAQDTHHWATEICIEVRATSILTSWTGTCISLLSGLQASVMNNGIE